MEKEINFRQSSKMIPHLRNQRAKLLPLAAYPTSRNARVWLQSCTGSSKIYSLTSYDAFPATYFDFTFDGSARLTIKVEPRDLTATTRRHIYAFIRQYVPAKQAEVIINTARKTFALPPMSKDKYTNEPMHEMVFDVFPD